MYGQIAGHHATGRLIERQVRSAFPVIETIPWPEYGGGVLRRLSCHLRLCLQTKEGIAYLLMSFAPEEEAIVAGMMTGMRPLLPHEFVTNAGVNKPSYIKAQQAIRY